MYTCSSPALFSGLSISISRHCIRAKQYIFKITTTAMSVPLQHKAQIKRHIAEWLYFYLMSDIWANIARVPSALYYNILVLVTVQQLKCFPNLKETEQNKTETQHPSTYKTLSIWLVFTSLGYCFYYQK